MDPTEAVREEHGLDLTSAEPVLAGADRAALLWRAVAADGRAYAVKHSRGGSPGGLAVAAALAGVPGVPAPLRTRSGALWADRDGGRLSVVPWVGEPVGAGGLSPARWRAFGTLLAHVHATPVTAELDALLPRETHTHERQAAVVRDLAARVPGTVLDGVWHAATTETLIARADALGAALRGREAAYVVCHADPHAGNLLLGGVPGDDLGGTVWLVDWDDAMLAPRERDLSVVLAGVEEWAPLGDGGEAAFRDGYGPYEPDPERLAYHVCVRALEDLDFALTVLDPARTEPERDRALRIVRGLFAPGGIVPAALRASGGP